MISLENISKKFADKTLFTSSTFGIHGGEKIGLMGINGSGKSTLLKMIYGEEPTDTGSIIQQNGLTLHYLSQAPQLDLNKTIYEQICSSNHPHFQLLKEYNLLLQNNTEADKYQKRSELSAYSSNSNSKISCLPSNHLTSTLDKLYQQIERENAWEIEIKAKALLTTLGFKNLNITIGNLSGGQQRRIDLAGVLLDSPDVILLDEPTNHLDTDIIEWLQDYLISYKGIVIFVTHDRYFLDAVANKILEIDRQRIQIYEGNYSEYLKRKELEEIDLQRKEIRRQAQLQKELKWLARGAKARTSKPKDHVDRVKELISKSYLTTQQEMDISFQTQRLGKTILELRNLTIGYNDRVLLKDFNYNFQKMDRIGIIGGNGCGKSTLLKVIMGEILPLAGKKKLGHNTKIAYLSQNEPELDLNLTVNDYIKSFAENIRTKDGILHTAEQILEKFLFDRKKQMHKIFTLSGGEKKRLYLLSALIFGSNFLILDEPTNDLDIQTLGILEDYLDAYQGCIILVSHDRYILDRIVDFLFIFQEDQTIRKFPGNYTDYLIFQKFEKEQRKEKNIHQQGHSICIKNDSLAEKKTSKLSYKAEQLQIRAEKEIARLEQEKSVIHSILTNNTDQLQHYDYLHYSSKLDEIENEINQWYEVFMNTE